MRPYLELRALEFPRRPLAEVAAFSADARSYLTAHGSQWMWGRRLRLYPKPEGELFPGVVVILLATAGVGAEASRAGGRHGSSARVAGDVTPNTSRWCSSPLLR